LKHTIENLNNHPDIKPLHELQGTIKAHTETLETRHSRIVNKLSEKVDGGIQKRIGGLLDGKFPESDEIAKTVITQEATLAALFTEVNDGRDACEILDINLRKARTKVSHKIIDRLSSDHNLAQTALANAILQVQAALLEIAEVRAALAKNGVETFGHWQQPDWLPSPNDYSSSMADWLRAAKENGWIRSVPKELTFYVSFGLQY
jgi:hypothetical protein